VDAESLLTQRYSIGKLQKPAPSEEALQLMWQAALRAPDHAGLTPYRFLVYRTESALTQLGETFLQAKIQSGQQLDEAQREKTRHLPLRAPMMVIAIACLQEHPKVPEIEQIITTGCAVHGMLYALQAKGFAGYWRTGELAFNAELMKLLGLQDNERIVGFLYCGTPMFTKTTLPERDVADFVEFRDE